MTKTLILYYSFEGNTEMAAQWMAEATGADLFKIQPVRELKSKGFSKYIWGGRQVVMKEAPPIQPLDMDLNEYERILLGSPIWAGTCAPPIFTLLRSGLLQGKEIHYFYTHDGGAAKAVERIRPLIGDGNRLASTLGILTPSTDLEKKRLEAAEWARRAAGGR